MAKWYLRIVGLFFVLVSVPLVADYAQFGFRPETMHKVFHVLLGLIVVRYGWNDPRWWRPFAVANGGLFTFVGLFGWLFPDFGGLDAFNRLDTVLHSIVGLSGLAAGWPVKSRAGSLLLPGMTFRADLAVLFEHPEWQKPLFQALERRGVRYLPVDLRKAAFSDGDAPLAPLYFNQASPSAYVRGNTRAVPYALSYMRTLQMRGVRVLNGADAFALELSKTAQAVLLRELGVPTPQVWTFNDLEAIRARAPELPYPVLLKPEQGGSGARIMLVESFAHLEALLTQHPEHWLPDNLLLLQEYFPTDPASGIVRMEFLGGELLYAMRVISHGRFNLCPAPVCNPEGAEGGVCETPLEQESAPPVEFHPYREVPAQAVQWGKRVIAAGKLDVAGVEYLEARDGRLVFYDINANSNLRPSIAQAFGFDPFERVVDFLVREMKGAMPRTASSAARGIP